MRCLFPVSLIADAEQLYSEYHQAVYAYLRRLTGSAEWAEDLLQETFYRAIRSAATYGGQASPLTWLCAIGRRVYLTQAKGRALRLSRTGEVDWESVRTPQPGPEAEAIHRENRQEIALVLAALPEQQRIALLLRDWDGLSYETVADLLGLSLANVKVTIHRARKRFQTLYRSERSDGHEDA